MLYPYYTKSYVKIILTIHKLYKILSLMSCPYPPTQHNIWLIYPLFSKKVIKISDYDVERGTLTNIFEGLEDSLKLKSTDLTTVTPKMDMKFEKLLS